MIWGDLISIIEDLACNKEEIAVEAKDLPNGGSLIFVQVDSYDYEFELNDKNEVVGYERL